MKKIIIKILLILSLFGLIGVSFIDISYAEGISSKSSIKVIVTEEIPGAGCNNIGTPEKPKWECTVEKGFGSVVTMMGAIIKYFTFIAGLGGVLYLVINGIMYSMGGIDQSLKDESKKRIGKTLTGLVLLLLSGVILNIIAPWIYK